MIALKKMKTLPHHPNANTIDSLNGEELYPIVRDNISKSTPAAENILKSTAFQKIHSNKFIKKDGNIKRKLSTETKYINNSESVSYNISSTIISNSHHRRVNINLNSSTSINKKLPHNNIITSNNNTLISTKIDPVMSQENIKTTEGLTDQYHISNKINAAIDNAYICIEENIIQNKDVTRPNSNNKVIDTVAQLHLTEDKRVVTPHRQLIQRSI